MSQRRKPALWARQNMFYGKRVTTGKCENILVSLYVTRKRSRLTSAQSRHTVVCRAAQEAGAQPREYIDRKKENAIFAPP